MSSDSNVQYSSLDDTPPRHNQYSVGDVIESMSLGCFHVRLFLVAAALHIVEALILTHLEISFPAIECEWKLDASQVALLTTAFFAGMVCGAPCWGLIAHQFGRKPALFLRTAMASYFFFLSAFSPNHAVIIFMEFLVGAMLVGGTQLFVLLTEYVGSKYRAPVILMKQAVWATGNIIEFLLAWAIIPSLGWRYFFGIIGLICALAMSLWPLIPESCRFLLMSGKKDETARTLVHIAKLNRFSLPEGELNTDGGEPQGRVQDLYERKYLRSTLQISLLWFVVGFCYYGIALVTTELIRSGYCAAGQDVLASSNKTSEACGCMVLTGSDYSRIIITAVSELSIVPIMIFLAEAIGRRWMIGLCNVIMGTCFFILLSCVGGSWGVTILLFVLKGSAGSAFTALYLYVPEVYPTQLRSLGFAFTYPLGRVGALITPFVAQVLLRTSVDAALILYGVVGFVAAVVAILLPIETKGRHLE